MGGAEFAGLDGVAALERAFDLVDLGGVEFQRVLGIEQTGFNRIGKMAVDG